MAAGMGGRVVLTSRPVMDIHRYRLFILAAVCLACLIGEATAQTITSLGFQSFSSIQVHRFLEEDSNSQTVSALTTRTKRVDPLNDLKKYRGGYNITNKHYWSSAIFTGKYGYSIAAVWLFVGIVYAGVLLVTTICFNKNARRTNKRPLSFKRFSLWLILLGVFLTLLSIIASGVVLGGSSRFHSRAKSTKNIIVVTTQEATGTIYNVTEAVTAMEAETKLFGDSEVSSNLNSTLHKLNDDAANIQSKTEKDMRLLNKGINILKVVIIVTVVLNLIVVLSLLVSATLRFRRSSHMLISISWILTTLFWIFFGLYFFLDKFAGDTCAALEEYRQDPQNSTLSSILRCNDQLSAMSVLRDTGLEIHSLINQANSKISTLQSTYPGLEYVCNPISGPPLYSYQPENCSSNTIQIGDIAQILKSYTCSGNDSGTCKQGEFISAGDYSRVVIFTSSVQTILNAFPGIKSLVNCQLVKNAFSDIHVNECKPLKKYARMTWAALLALSTIMVALLLTWTFEAHQDRKSYTSDGSVKPQLLPIGSSDIDSTEMDSKKMEPKLEP